MTTELVMHVTQCVGNPTIKVVEGHVTWATPSDIPKSGPI